jgi:hypothetical protein
MEKLLYEDRHQQVTKTWHRGWNSLDITIMLFQWTLAAAAALLGIVHTHDISAPKGVPITGSYTGTLRPQVHFSPPKEFMNDPNGMFKDAKGIWHLYYQCELIMVVVGLSATCQLAAKT